MKLVLFCGGPAIYGNGVPKPLMVLNEGETLLGLFSKTNIFRNASSVELLVEDQFESDFAKEAKLMGPHVRLRASEDFSSTGNKLRDYCRNSAEPETLTIFSYPDIFFFGEIGGDFLSDDSKVWLSSRSALSRFPRFFPEPYGPRLLSISGPGEKQGSNRVLMFGGHIIAKPEILIQALDSWMISNDSKNPILEEQGFSFLVRSGLAAHFELLGNWLQADSPRDLARIANQVDQLNQ